MRQSKLMILSAGISMALSAETISAARADIFVDVYEYAGNVLGTDADAPTLANILAHPGSFTQYQFTYTALNDITWNNGGDQTSPNLAGTFINVADITSFVGGPATEAAFLATTLSVQGDAQTAFFDISGSITGIVVSGIVVHDDGASFVIGGVTKFNNPAETNNTPYTFPGGVFNGAPLICITLRAMGLRRSLTCT
jgi:hypothetical protein